MIQRAGGRGVDNISVIESEIVKLKAGAVRQQITSSTSTSYCRLFNGGSSSWKIETSIFFYDLRELSLINTIQSGGEEGRQEGYL